ncbi:hypothetical protein T07_14398 [Trichinella nelsoni]|uniref:Uncharacterized protein n=1 Tax=Trichinella nelsoni TaxID=6336 RepID=A0A0V0RZ91_9BILA|nr:hypothetical protein T07_14398 [Trichinella nelsoni]
MNLNIFLYDTVAGATSAQVATDARCASAVTAAVGACVRAFARAPAPTFPQTRRTVALCRRVSLFEWLTVVSVTTIDRSNGKSYRQKTFKRSITAVENRNMKAAYAKQKQSKQAGRQPGVRAGRPVSTINVVALSTLLEQASSK